MFPDLTGRVALVTGGTRGLGLATGLALGRHGAQVWLTHRWGSVDPREVSGQFAAAGAVPPRIVEADVARDEDTAALFDALAATHDRLDLLVVNACVAAVGGSLSALRRRDLTRCLTASAWSLPAYVQHCRRATGHGPARVVVMSSDGVRNHHPRYDYVALAKAALESLAGDPQLVGDARVFLMRTRQSTTGGFTDVFGDDTLATLRRFARFAVAPQDIGRAVLACASGYLDALHGQPLQIDHGAAWLDNVLTAQGLA
jgi:NAD(P)-dependent dehydrogenase (short-subunit alcohol dehydrogenase family)